MATKRRAVRPPRRRAGPKRPRRAASAARPAAGTAAIACEEAPADEACFRRVRLHPGRFSQEFPGRWYAHEEALYKVRDRSGRVVCLDLPALYKGIADLFWDAATAPPREGAGEWTLAGLKLERGFGSSALRRLCGAAGGFDFPRMLGILRRAEPLIPEGKRLHAYGDDAARPLVLYYGPTPHPTEGPGVRAAVTPAVETPDQLDDAIRFLGSMALEAEPPYGIDRFRVTVADPAKLAPFLESEWVDAGTLSWARAGFAPPTLHGKFIHYSALAPLFSARTPEERAAVLRDLRSRPADYRHVTERLFASPTWAFVDPETLIRVQETDVDWAPIAQLLSAATGISLVFPSGRPYTSMAIFRRAEEGLPLTLDPAALSAEQALAALQGDPFPVAAADLGLPEDAPDRWLVPVSRYAAGMHRGLYYGKQGASAAEQYCGVFFYVEPGADVLLDMGPREAFAVFHTKVDAALGLASRARFPETRRWLENAARNVVEGVARVPGLFAPDLSREERELRALALLVGERAPGVLVDPDTYSDASGDYFGNAWYAREDPLDQPLCRAARELRLNALILTHMVARTRAVAEVLDSRPRLESFAHLVFVLPQL